MLDINELKGMDSKSLASKITELRGKIFGLKLQKVTSGLEKPHQLKDLKRDVARCLTALNAGKKGK